MRHILTSASVAVLLAASVAAVDEGIQCFIPGECLDSQTLELTSTNTSTECLKVCQVR